jgi:hypothetical protein
MKGRFAPARSLLLRVIVSIQRVLMSLIPLAVVGAIAVAPQRALASDGAARAPLTQEIVGLEVSGPSLAFGDGLSPRLGIGIGGLLRLGRHRWAHAYITPVAGGLFVGTGTVFDYAISARVLTEAGVVLRSAAGVFELGLGAGLGLLSIPVKDSRCHDACAVGGNSLLLSPVVRWLFRETGPLALGVVLRGDVPTSDPTTPGIDYFVGYGAQVLLGLDVGLGW